MHTDSEFKAVDQLSSKPGWMRFAEGIRVTELPQGILVVTHKTPFILNPVVDIVIQVNAGRLHEEGKYTPGIAHFYEHMSFERSKNFEAVDHGTGEIPGVDGKFISKTKFNGGTGYETTTYTLENSFGKWKRGFEALADKLCRPSFDENSLHLHQGIVTRERIESDQSNVRTPANLSFVTAFGSDPEKLQVLGSRKNILQFSLGELERFEKQFVRANNIIIAAEGPISHRKLVDMTRSHFDLPPGEKAPPVSLAYTGGYAEKRTGEEDVIVHLGFSGGPHVNPAHAEKLNEDLDAAMGRAFRKEGLSYTPFARSQNITGLHTLVISYTTAPSEVHRTLSIIREAMDNIIHSPEEKIPPPLNLPMREWLLHPYRSLQSKLPPVTHSPKDIFLHPVTTAATLLAKRFGRRGAETLAFDLLTEGHVPSANSLRHAYLTTTPADKAALVRKILEQPPTYTVEGNPDGVPDYATVSAMFRIQPDPGTIRRTHPKPEILSPNQA